MVKDFSAARENMIRTQLIPRGIRDQRVLEAMKKVPRERFVPEPMKSYAYEDTPSSIGNYQTISQPYIVALMTESLELTGEERTLEIGTGSGYQTAVLAQLSKAVYTVERIESLSESASEILEELGYTNIYLKVSDGTLGWSENASYDAIMVTAGSPRIPKLLLEQLKEGGRLMVPVGDRISQDLIKIVRKDNSFYKENMGGVRFVQLIGENGWSG